MEKGILCIDVSTAPPEMDIVTWFKLLEEKNTIFYDSRRNPKAIPPYAIKGEAGDIAILDIADEKIKAKFDLMIKIEEIDDTKKDETI